MRTLYALSSTSRPYRSFRHLRPVVTFLVVLFASALLGAQSLPSEIYGPYNATFLPDGPGLSKKLAAPPAPPSPFSHADPNPLVDERSIILKGHASWSLAFWFHSSDPLSGTLLLAGIGDPAAEDARYLAVEDNHLALWLGSAQGQKKLIAASSPLTHQDWHLAVAVSDGDKITLYSDGAAVASTTLVQGNIAPRLEMASSALPLLASHHFGGEIAGLRIYTEALTAGQISTILSAPPDFKSITYEEATRHWAVQTSGMVGLTAPQDPSTLPRGKGAIQKPVAKPLSREDLRTQLVGGNPWRLKGGWKLIAEPDLDSPNGALLSKPGVDTKAWLDATVPGTVLTTMIDRGVYPDSDYGLNNLAIPETLAHHSYWYRAEFGIPAQSRGRRLTLTFEGINYAAEVWLNGKNLGGITGAFIRGQFDVTSIVSDSGPNFLAVKISPPPHPGIAQEQSIKGGPGDNGGMQMLDGPTFGATEGWDWIPGIRDRNTGIWQDVTLTASGPVEVGDLQVVTTLPKPDRSEADLEIEVPLVNATGSAVEGEITAAFDNVKVSKHVTAAPGESIVRLEPAGYAQLKIQNPKLWWPNGYGEPALHKLTVSFLTSGSPSSSRQIDFGMRELSYELSLMDKTGHIQRVELLPSRTHDQGTVLIDNSHQGIRRVDDRTPSIFPASLFPLDQIPEQFRDYFRYTWVHSLRPQAEGTASIKPVEGGWPGTDLVIKVNGVRIAARGGNWGMDDSRKRVGIDHLEPYFRLHRDAHVNIIRDWMGQDTEENFYALADKYGLMVWNDFWESTQGFNVEAQDPALFLKNAEDTIRRFRHHPSIVVWCGRNEGVPQPIINQGLADLVNNFDHTRYYTGSSNQINLRGSGPYQYMAPETYYNINRGFSVELGIPSIPTLEAIKSFIPEPDRWPISDTWAYHDFHILGNGAVAPFMEHMETEFGAPTSLEDFERKAQMLDYVGHRAIFEGFAAHLWEPNSARLIWMTQPAWPSMEWNFLGSDYDTQSSFYATQKACEPVHAQLNLVTNAVDLINIGEAKSYKVTMRVVGLDGKVLSDHTNQIQAAANARTAVGEMELEKLAAGHTVLVELNVTGPAGLPVSTNLYWWSKDESKLRELNDLPQVKLDSTATLSTSGAERNATVEIRNSGSVPALLAKLTLKDAASGERILPAYYSDNYISLLPGESRTITIAFPAGQDKPAIALRGWNITEAAIDVK